MKCHSSGPPPEALASATSAVQEERVSPRAMLKLREEASKLRDMCGLGEGGRAAPEIDDPAEVWATPREFPASLRA